MTKALAIAMIASASSRRGKASAGEIPYRPTRLREISSFMISDVPP